MNKTQLELYHNNLVSFYEAIQLVGGMPRYVLKDSRPLLETLARNGLEISFVLHPNSGVKSE